MKRIPMVAALFVALLAMAMLVPASQAQDKAQDKIETPDAEVYVDGLACPFCAYGLEKKLKKLDAVQKMEVQLEKGRVLLVFKEDQTLTEKEIQQAVKKAGFTARKIEFPDETPSASTSS